MDPYAFFASPSIVLKACIIKKQVSGRVIKDQIISTEGSTLGKARSIINHHYSMLWRKEPSKLFVKNQASIVLQCPNFSCLIPKRKFSLQPAQTLGKSLWGVLVIASRTVFSLPLPSSSIGFLKSSKVAFNGSDANNNKASSSFLSLSLSSLSYHIRIKIRYLSKIRIKHPYLSIQIQVLSHPMLHHHVLK